MSTSAAVAGPSNPRKRPANLKTGVKPASAPIESFGRLELAQAAGDDDEDGVDEEYSSVAESDDDDEAFPEIDIGTDGSDDEDDEDDEELSEDEQILRELAEEEALERELQETSDSSLSDDEVDPDDPDALSRAIAKATSKPVESFEGDSADVHASNSKMLGYDTRNFREKAVIGQSDITGKERWTWADIEPGWESDEGAEEGENRVGNIPAYFYEGMPHVGYSMDGKKILRPAKGDELDKFLATIDDPTSWTSVEDKSLQKNVQLTPAELDLIQRLAKAENPDANYDPYAPTVEWFTGKGKEMATPLSGAPEPKRRFVPSKWEHKKVMKIVRAIRQGRIVPRRPKEEDRPNFYAIWSASDEPQNLNHPMHMPAPKMKLPGHEESYNPPAEYLFTKDEQKGWDETEPSDRKMNFVPQKHDSLRKVPGYDNFMQERFDRLLDLYLAPRSKKRKPKILEGVTKPEDLLPKLPDPRELKPFPTFCAVTYVHPRNVRVRCVSVDVSGSWVLTGAEDGCVRLWECRRGKCLKTWRVSATAPIHSVEWCPDRTGDKGLLFAASTAGKIIVGAPLDFVSADQASALLEYAHAGFSISSEGLPPTVDGVQWARGGTAASKAEAAAAPTLPPSSNPEGDEQEEKLEHNGILLQIAVPGIPKQVTWHRRGDYLASVAPEATGGTSVLLHQISKHSTQAPFRRLKGQVQKVIFHPTKAHLLVATERAVRIYDLAAQSLLRTLLPGVRQISSLDVHPGGENVLVGSYDRRVVWHDLDLSDRPYRTLRYHPRAVRQASFSPRWPLFLSTSDDGTVQVFHSTVYSDLVTNPLIVPLKVLRGHQITEGLGVLDANFHPREPWIVSAGADGTAKLWM